MLFHVSLIHDGAHCPGFHPELRPKLMESMEKREEIARRHNVKIHAFYSVAPEHLDILILEAETPFALGWFIAELWPYELAKIEAKAVVPLEEMEAVARQMMGR